MTGLQVVGGQDEIGLYFVLHEGIVCGRFRIKLDKRRTVFFNGRVCPRFQQNSGLINKANRIIDLAGEKPRHPGHNNQH